MSEEDLVVIDSFHFPEDDLLQIEINQLAEIFKNNPTIAFTSGEVHLIQEKYAEIDQAITELEKNHYNNVFWTDDGTAELILRLHKHKERLQLFLDFALTSQQLSSNEFLEKFDNPQDQKNVALLQQDIREKEAQLSATQLTQQELEQKHYNLTNQLEQLTLERDELRHTNNTLQQEYDEKIRQLEAQLQIAQDQCNEALAQVENLRAELESARAEIVQLKEIIAQLESQQQEAAAAAAAAVAAATAESAVVAAALATNQESQDEAEAVVGEDATASNEETAAEQLAGHESLLADKHAELDALQLQYEKLLTHHEQQASYLETAETSLREERQRHEIQLAEQQARLTEQEDRLASYQQLIEENKRLHDALVAHEADAATRHQELSQRHADLQDQLQQRDTLLQQQTEQLTQLQAAAVVLPLASEEQDKQQAEVEQNVVDDQEQGDNDKLKSDDDSAAIIADLQQQLDAMEQEKLVFEAQSLVAKDDLQRCQKYAEDVYNTLQQSNAEGEELKSIVFEVKGMYDQEQKKNHDLEAENEQLRQQLKELEAALAAAREEHGQAVAAAAAAVVVDPEKFISRDEHDQAVAAASVVDSEKYVSRDEHDRAVAAASVIDSEKYVSRDEHDQAVAAAAVVDSEQFVPRDEHDQAVAAAAVVDEEKYVLREDAAVASADLIRVAQELGAELATAKKSLDAEESERRRVLEELQAERALVRDEQAKREAAELELRDKIFECNDTWQQLQDEQAKVLELESNVLTMKEEVELLKNIETNSVKTLADGKAEQRKALLAALGNTLQQSLAVSHELKHEHGQHQDNQPEHQQQPLPSTTVV